MRTWPWLPIVGFILCWIAAGIAIAQPATDDGGPDASRRDRPAPSTTTPRAPASSPKSIRELINRAAARYDVEPALVHAVVSAESAYNPNAVSSAGAIGLMQIMPATGADYGVDKASDLFDPSLNVNVGVRHLRRLLQKYGNDYRRVILAYNAGEGVVDRTDGRVTYTETVDYAARVTRAYRRLGGARSIADSPALEVAKTRVGLAGDQRGTSSLQTPDRGKLLPKSSPRLNRDLAGNRATAPSPVPPASLAQRSASLEVGRRPAIDPACDSLRGGTDPQRETVVRRCSSGPTRRGISRGF